MRQLFSSNCVSEQKNQVKFSVLQIRLRTSIHKHPVCRLERAGTLISIVMPQHPQQHTRKGIFTSNDIENNTLLLLCIHFISRNIWIKRSSLWNNFPDIFRFFFFFPFFFWPSWLRLAAAPLMHEEMYAGGGGEGGGRRRRREGGECGKQERKRGSETRNRKWDRPD